MLRHDAEEGLLYDHPAHTRSHVIGADDVK